jgi:beta-glucosidase
MFAVLLYRVPCVVTSSPRCRTPLAQAVDFTDFSVASLGRTYRYHTSTSPGGAPLFEFGSGGSYTTHELSWPGGVPPAALMLRCPVFNATITALVSNTGPVDGDEVVQAYIIPISVSPPVPPYLPLRQLLAFQRVHVPMGATVPVTLSITSETLVLTDVNGVRGPLPGVYHIIISRGPPESAADDLSLNATVLLYSQEHDLTRPQTA